MNTYLKYQSPTQQFLSFLGLASGFFILSFIISNYFFSGISTVISNKNAVISADIIHQFKLAQFVTAIISFLFPALLFGYFSSPKPMPYVGLQKSISAILLLLSVVLLAFVQPFAGWLGQINSKINFGPLQAPLQNAEAVYNRALEVFLRMESVKDLLVNLVIIALLPALAEELFFRGALQKALLRLTTKPWIAILISSGIFALLHGTFFKIIPIFTLGILLGTVYYFTQNLWYTITIHFLNNALAVLAFYFANRSETVKRFANDNISVPLYGAMFSLIVVLVIMYFIKKKSDEVHPEAVTNENNDYIA